MKFLIVTGSPKDSGLTHAIMEKVIQGAKDGGAEVEVMKVDGFQRCKMCADGWGKCWDDKVCAYGDEDGFNEAQQKFGEADMYCLISPVYWGEATEGMKALMDKIRRCEWGEGKLNGKKALLISVPGGNGGNSLGCLEQMQRYISVGRARVFDWVAVNRWNNDYKAETAYAAAKAMAEGRNAGDTVGYAEEMKQTLRDRR